MNRLLVTGANHPVARAIIVALQSNYAIRAVDLDPIAALPQIETVSGDLRDTNFVEAIVDRVDGVLHLAPLYTRLASDSATIDHATRGSYQLANAVHAAGVSRFVLGSSLDLFAQLSQRFWVDESWRPRPQPELDQLCCYLAETAVREVTRVTGVPTLCLRFGHIVDDETAQAGHIDPRWLHLEDAITAVRRALQVDLDGWTIHHIAAAGQHTQVPVARASEPPFNYTPQHAFPAANGSTAAPALIAPQQYAPIPSRPIRNVVLFGAGGPLGAAVAQELMPHYTLRLTDVQSIEQLADMAPQSAGAPLPAPVSVPHAWQVVDVRDAAQVHAACMGMDAIVNCSVVRNDPADAFRVNTLGALHVMQAAVAHQIRRVVHTGPFMLGQTGAAGYQWDYTIVDDVPPRPGTGWVYFPSKLLGQEIAAIYARAYDLETPCLTFCQFYNPEVPRDRFLHPLSVSWQDAARAIRCALQIESLPSPFEYMHVGTNLPHGVYPTTKAQKMLGWQPQDHFEALYLRNP